LGTSHQFGESLFGKLDVTLGRRLRFLLESVPHVDRIGQPSLHQLDFAWTPGLVEPRFERSVAADSADLWTLPIPPTGFQPRDRRESRETGMTSWWKFIVMFEFSP